MENKLRELCDKAAGGKISADSFYDSLRAIADDDRTDGDLSCLLEDVIMELEMLHDEGGSDKKMRELTAEAAERIIEEWF
ncbi:MAG: hypothetical protein IJ446_10075 [Oscillospiraceae bacterium]|nr:hypothetical protein [Oscillospiraceae bacterium]